MSYFTILFSALRVNLGIPMCTLSKQEILEDAIKIRFDILETRRLGTIDTVPENLVEFYTLQ